MSDIFRFKRKIFSRKTIKAALKAPRVYPYPHIVNHPKYGWCILLFFPIYVNEKGELLEFDMETFDLKPTGVNLYELRWI